MRKCDFCGKEGVPLRDLRQVVCWAFLADISRETWRDLAETAWICLDCEGRSRPLRTLDSPAWDVEYKPLNLPGTKYFFFPPSIFSPATTDMIRRRAMREVDFRDVREVMYPVDELHRVS